MDLIFWKFGVSRAVPAPPGMQHLFPAEVGRKNGIHALAGVWSCSEGQMLIIFPARSLW